VTLSIKSIYSVVYELNGNEKMAGTIQAIDWVWYVSDPPRERAKVLLHRQTDRQTDRQTPAGLHRSVQRSCSWSAQGHTANGRVQLARRRRWCGRLSADLMWTGKSVMPVHCTLFTIQQRMMILCQCTVHFKVTKSATDVINQSTVYNAMHYQPTRLSRRCCICISWSDYCPSSSIWTCCWHAARAGLRCRQRRRCGCYNWLHRRTGARFHNICTLMQTNVLTTGLKKQVF